MGTYRNRVYKSAADTETIVFNGREYHRNPNAKQKHRRRYFWGRRELGDKKKVALHVAIWEHHHGPVPEGMVIHHRDDDPLNNDIANLQCVTYSEHGTLHGNGRNFGPRHAVMYRHVCQQCGAEYESFRKRKTKFCCEACEKQFRRDNKLHHETRICIICGESFIADKYRTSRTCSHRCRARLNADNRKAKATGRLQPECC